MGVPRYEIEDFGDVVASGTAVRDGVEIEISITHAQPDVAQRALDFFAGVAVTGAASMTRVARGVFLITPGGPAAGAVGAPAGGAAEPLISLPRRRPLSDLGTTVGAKFGPQRGMLTEQGSAPRIRRQDRPFWPGSRRG